jgi:hypothetical protein
MCTMALILSRLASIPFIDTKQPKTLPFCVPNTHFLDYSLVAPRTCWRRSWLDHLFVFFSFYLPPQCHQSKRKHFFAFGL